MINETYLLEMKSFTWDSGNYEECQEFLRFNSYKELKDFYDRIISLPVPHWEMPYFGEFKDIKDFSELYEEIRNNEFYINGGGISTKMKASLIKQEEIPLPL